jgi:hypothetical protein
MDDDGQIYTARVILDTVGGIAPLADINNARLKYLGKTLCRIRGSILTYNHKTEKFGTVNFKRYAPVKVVNVVAGWDDMSPVRFILQTPSGEEGFIDVSLSGTNVSSGRGNFDDWFLVEDPRKTYRWPEKIWSAIEGGRVLTGMTAEQARMSWGKPKEVNRTITGTSTHEQWVYGSGSYLYFEDAILKGVQN